LRGAIEGDFIETDEGLLFDVKGFYHPQERIMAFLRYYPASGGERKRGKVRYKKVYDIDERNRYLQRHFPHYLYDDPEFGGVQTVCRRKIIRVYDPRQFLLSLTNRKMIPLERISFNFCTLLSEMSRVPLPSFGISGSLLVGLSEKGSDIDIVVYGKKSGLSVFSVLQELRKRGIARAFSGKPLEDMCKFRWGHVTDRLKTIESQKLLHGTFEGTPYFVRLLRKPRRERFKQLGLTRIEGEVVNRNESIFTPCMYGINSEKAQRLFSYRGRYCEHLNVGDRFSVKARLEEVSGWGRQVVLAGEEIKIQ
jgi:predicted nucleotidyltransferase